MDASALDEILNWMDADGYGVPIGTHERKDEAREELAALRARVEDLELIARHALRTSPNDYRLSDGTWRFADSRGVVRLPDDGTGLPLLTAEARRALRGEP